jgi:hypothetical protein
MSMDNFILWAFLAALIFTRLKIYLWRFMLNFNELKGIMYQILARFKIGPYEKYGFHYIDIHGTQDL